MIQRCSRNLYRAANTIMIVTFLSFNAMAAVEAAVTTVKPPLAAVKPHLAAVEPPLAAVEPTVTSVSPAPAFSKEDSVITETIKQTLSSNQRISSPNIDVKTNHGVVSLIGHFNDPAEAGAAIEDIAATPGVSDIDVSQVVLGTGIDSSFSDLVITSRIKGLYVREKAFGANPVSVMTIETKDGVVFLTGAVDDTAQRQKAIDLAETVPNIKKVVPKISIKFPR